MLFFLGKCIQKTFKLPFISTGIIFYFIFAFLLNNLFLFFLKNISFSSFFFFYNVLLFFLILIRKVDYKNFIYFMAFTFINFIYNSSIYNFKNNVVTLKGDVFYQWFPMAKNIYDNNYYYSLNNPFLDGYGQLISYTHAMLFKLNYNFGEFEFINSTVNVLLPLTILIIFELNIAKKNKFLLSIFFTVMVINSQWLNYLFVNSLMGEGVTSYFFCVAFFTLISSLKSEYNENIPFIIFGSIYFTKQFVSVLVLLICLLIIFKKEQRIKAPFLFLPIIINEFNLLGVLKNSKRDAYASDFDFRDTLLDLMTNTNLELSNILIIFKNIFRDKPLTYILITFILLFFITFLYGFNKSFDNYLFFAIFCLNFLFILTLYVSAWRNMPELESPVRYILNLFHTTIIYIFINTEKIENSYH